MFYFSFGLEIFEDHQWFANKDKSSVGRAVIDYSDQEHGKASLLKLIGNVFIVNMIETIAEGLTLAEKNDLGVENLQKMLGVVFPGPYMIYSKHMISGGYYQDEVGLIVSQFPLFQISCHLPDNSILTLKTAQSSDRYGPAPRLRGPRHGPQIRCLPPCLRGGGQAYGRRA